jgi:hypothetical protein
MQNFQGVECLAVPYAEERLTPMGLPSCVFFRGEFSQPGERKKGLANPTKEISITLHQAIWFGKSQHDRIKQSKLSTFIHKLNYM